MMRALVALLVGAAVLGIVNARIVKQARLAPADEDDAGETQAVVSTSRLSPSFRQMTKEVVRRLLFTDLELIPQSTRASCWAACCAMVYGWYHHQSVTDSMIAEKSGHDQNTGLDTDDVSVFSVWDMETEPLQSYTPQGIYELLDKWGPLWFASDPVKDKGHIRVLYGIETDSAYSAEKTTIYVADPWQEGMTTYVPGNRGSKYTRQYLRLMQDAEDRSVRVMPDDGSTFNLIAHMTEPRSSRK